MSSSEWNEESLRELASHLEFHLCELFPLMDRTRWQHPWCDGVFELSVKQATARSFLLTGLAWCPNRFAPFEMALHFENRGDTTPTRTVLRLGEDDGHGKIRWHANPNNAQQILIRRPQQLYEWAVAVEFSDI